ncbi:BON domain-containing protein [Crocosphaera sp. XPORK-15E]|uniref:BON domain-containing protein n=1 Tax=Crocosphaera sp. XPORK-15E TaxID=3110247 RepID=UPI002B210B19|nr:BON domain-containing protein [Crocosphaera sp. XPORK-15E]MEA5534655.1 BON domain-containing protein [Crocosphaera sp. XPORK-15E]
MNKLTKISSTLPLLLSVLLMVTVSGCASTKTTSDAPNTTDKNGQASTKEEVKTIKDDAQSDTRRQQLDSDIRAREQRNNIGGDAQERAEGDLANEVRSKLEANIPRGRLTVTAKKSDVTVSGTVKTQDELNKIEPLAMEIKGVNTVMVKAVVKP